jgi:hypothetical protein
MNIDEFLIGKILDPIHGIIRLTPIEIEVINHPLFQRLRNIKQNSFLYKVFPSAVHSRFEHSLGVLHLSYEILKNLNLNSVRYKCKYKDGHVFSKIQMLSTQNTQELRLAALLHDIGHGPMSHQFDSFMPTKNDLANVFNSDYPKIIDLLENDNSKFEHEHISLLFINKILDDINYHRFEPSINKNNILKMVDKNYDDKNIESIIDGQKLNILPLFTSIISSCPIDADRMDYLLRDSYFSGVKCGIYDYNRLFMSIVPVEQNSTLYLAYKESGIDSIAEFIGARSSLFGQVYYHKTNRAFSAMLNKLCDKVNSNKDLNFIAYEVTENDSTEQDAPIVKLSNLYLFNTDDYFLNVTLPRWLDESDADEQTHQLLNDVIDRRPWYKIYETKFNHHNTSIVQSIDKSLLESIKNKLNSITLNYIPKEKFSIDIVTDNAFKDIKKSSIKLLVKKNDGSYEIKEFSECDDKLDAYQSIKYYIRLFVSRDKKDELKNNTNLINELDSIKELISSSLK